MLVDGKVSFRLMVNLRARILDFWGVDYWCFGVCIALHLDISHGMNYTSRNQ